MTHDENIDWQRVAARLEFELGRVRETVENQFGRIEALEQKLSPSPLEDLGRDMLELTNTKDDSALVFFENQSIQPQFFLEVPQSSPLAGTPGLSCYSLKGKVGLIFGIATFDQSVEELHHIVHIVMENQRRTRKFIPIFLTNNPDFTPFRSQKYMYEYFRTTPSLAECMDVPERRVFLQEKFQYVLKKWGIDMVLDMSKETAST